MIDLANDLTLVAMIAAGVLHYVRRRRIVANTNDAAEDLLDAVFAHWVIYNHVEHGVAKRMTAELRDHFTDVLANDGRLDDVVGPDLQAFADEWASTHGAHGPGAAWGWRTLSLACLLFAVVMIHRTVDLLRDGLAEIGFVAGVLFAVLFAVPIVLGLPWMIRLSNSGRTTAGLQRFATFLATSTAFIFLTGWALKEVLVRSGYSFDPQPGRWWLSALMIPFALTVGLLADEFPRRRRTSTELSA